MCTEKRFKCAKLVFVKLQNAVALQKKAKCNYLTKIASVKQYSAT